MVSSNQSVQDLIRDTPKRCCRLTSDEVCSGDLLLIYKHKRPSMFVLWAARFAVPEKGALTRPILFRVSCAVHSLSS